MNEHPVICGEAKRLVSYTNVPMKGIETGLRVTAYVNPNHTGYRFLGEHTEARARAYAEAIGGEYKLKPHPGSGSVEHLVRVQHDPA